MNHTSITGQGIGVLKNVTLESLSLHDSRISVQGLRELLTLDTIPSIYLDGCQFEIDDSALELLSSSPHNNFHGCDFLTSIEGSGLVELDGTNVSDEGLKYIARWASLSCEN